MSRQGFFMSTVRGAAIGCVEPTVTTTAEYTAVRAKASALGYTLPSPAQDAINNRIIFYYKFVGLWDKMDVFYFFEQEAGLADFCKLNWKNPDAFQLNQPTPGLVPTFVPGQGFDGTGGRYWFTGYIPRTSRINLSINNALCSYKVSGIPSTFSAVTYIAGARTANTNDQFFIANNASGQTLQRIFNINAGGLAQANQNGIFYTETCLFADLPDDYVNNGRFYRDKVGIIASPKGIDAETLLTTREVTLLAMNVNGSIATGGTPLLGFFSLGKSLNAGEITTDEEYIEHARTINDIPKGTYLACI
jgi:hypothetical protein